MFKLEDSGEYSVRAVNEAGEAVSVAIVSIEETPPPRPPQPDIGWDTKPSRSVSPSSCSTSTGRELGPESLALRTLASHKRYNKPLPDLLPFPFKPDQPIQQSRKNNTKVPKPSKFMRGEMYHSDYESDLEGPIRVKWRSAYSDTEDSYVPH